MVLYPNPNERARVVITSLAHKDTVEFFPYDFEFDDNYKPDWNSYDAFGRMDPIMVYKRTSREANLNFNVVAEESMFDDLTKPPTLGHAEYNFNQLQNLIKFLYPVYDNPVGNVDEIIKNKFDKLIDQQIRDPNITPEQFTATSQEVQRTTDILTQARQEAMDYGVQTIKKSPLITISFMNLLNNQQYVAAITSFKHKMKFDVGNSRFMENGMAYPGEININIGFRIVHTSIPGQDINYQIK